MGLLSGLMGSSGAPKPDGALIKDSDTQHFMEDVIQASRAQPVIVDFWAPWCAPCRALGPVLERLAEEQEGEIDVVKLNVDENPQVPGRYAIRGIPTLLLFKEGQLAETIVGLAAKEDIAKMIERHL